jgi:hypothetical protein
MKFRLKQKLLRNGIIWKRKRRGKNIFVKGFAIYLLVFTLDSNNNG